MLLRILLLIGNAVLLMFFAYVVIDSSIIHPHKEAILDYVVVYGVSGSNGRAATITMRS